MAGSSNSVTPKPTASACPSVDTLSISLENFRLNKATSKEDDSSRSNVSAGSSSRVETQRSEVANGPQFWTAANNMPPIPIRTARGEFLTPSNQPRDFWAGNNFRNQGEVMASNPCYGTGSNMGSLAPSSSMHFNNNPNMYIQRYPSQGTGTNSFNLSYGTYMSAEAETKSELFLLAMTEAGSRYLQTLIKNGDNGITNRILEGVIGSIIELMTGEYGHHLFQKLIDSCNGNQMTRILLALISPKELLIEASFNQYGSNSIRQLLKKLKKSPLLVTLTSALAFGFYSMMTHRTGQYVFQQCLNIQNNQQNEILYEVVIRHCIQLAVHEVGCLNLNQCIDCIKGPQRDRLLNLISEQSVFLSQDPSGNFVLQYVLKLQNPNIIDNICTRLQGNYIRLSLQKSGSYVVETCLGAPSHVARSCVVNELVASNKLLEVAKDQYGNYVIQKALKTTDCCDSELHHRLVQALKPHLSKLKFHRHGKNVCNLIDCGDSAQE